ncbi:phosphonate-binding protein [Gemmobacter aquarius]|uniref:Phosphonate-binding protein n=2 Tax=Paragemmobacter aquarius TaxID=2169400 RepID=A0A2S0UNY8_9RHOB|nr:phosphonate-binding protein [Gemmobacter aquarius]
MTRCACHAFFMRPKSSCHRTELVRRHQHQLGTTMKTILQAGLFAFATLTAQVAVAQDTIRFAVTDIDGMEALQKEMGPFKDAFEAASGLKVEFFPVSGRTIAVEAMAADQIDFVLTGPAEYVVFNARLKAQPVVTWNRPDYYANVVVLDASPVKSAADLKGQKISFGEIGSTSQHLSPASILAEAGLVYGTDYEPVFLKRNVAMEALIAGDIAAIGLNKTHIDQITEKFPDQKLRVLLKGGELPNDVLLASASVAPEVVDAVRKTFTEHGDELLAAITATEENAKFIGGGFTATVTDADYDNVRKMFENVGVTEFTQILGE